MEESVRIRPDNGAVGDNMGVVADSVDRVEDVLGGALCGVVGVAVEVPVGVLGVRWGRVGAIGEAGDTGDAAGEESEEGMDGGLRVSDFSCSVFMGGDSVVGGDVRSATKSKSCWSAPSKLLENLLDVLLVLGLSLPRTLSYTVGEDR
tara:strand:- start:316 stop:759 length:444 start_codon:yes stop_codon:yes gene_type:complete